MLQEVSLLSEGGVVAFEDHVQNAPCARVFGHYNHPIAQHVVCIVKSCQDSYCVMRAPCDVIGRIVWVDDGEPVLILIRKSRYFVLHDLLLVRSVSSQGVRTAL